MWQLNLTFAYRQIGRADLPVSQPSGVAGRHTTQCSDVVVICCYISSKGGYICRSGHIPEQTYLDDLFPVCATETPVAEQRSNMLSRFLKRALPADNPFFYADVSTFPLLILFQS
jgi:hypothetical protein